MLPIVPRHRRIAVFFAGCILAATLICNPLLAQPPAPVAALLAHAQSLKSQGRPDLAAQVWKQILLADSRNQTALEQLARYDQQTGDHRGAEAMLRRLRAIDPQASLASIDAKANASARATAAQAEQRILAQRVSGQAEAAAYRALRQRNTALASQRFRAILDRNPRDAPALAGMGFVAMQQQNFSAALHWFELARRHGANNSGIRRAMATSHFWLSMQTATTALEHRQWNEAKSAAQYALQIQPGDPEATLLLARIFAESGQPATAMDLYREAAEENTTAANADAWAGWLKTSASLHQSQAAIAALDRLSADVRVQLQQHFEFSIGLSDAYAAADRSAEAEQALASALALPTSPLRREQAVLHYAALCVNDRHYASAEQAYRELLNRNPDNVAAWQGIVLLRHLQHNDTDAWKAFEQMPAKVQARSQEDASFLTLLAGIQQSQGKLSAARKLLLEAQTRLDAAGQQPSTESLRQMASLDLQLHTPRAAISLYRAALASSPQDADSWTGLLNALHQVGEDRQAESEQRQMPASVRLAIERDTRLSETYFQTMAGIEQSLGNLSAALDWLKKLDATEQQSSQSVNIELQEGWLQYNLHQDRDAETSVQRLQYDIRSSANLTTDQRKEISSLTANLALRRATELAAQGNRRAAVHILDAAAQQVGGDSKARIRLATGYLTAGEPAASIAIYQSVDMRNAAVGDIKAAIGAAMETQQKNLAQDWLAQALAIYPNDPGMLLLAGEFAQSNGNLPLAEKYLRTVLALNGKGGATTVNRKEKLSIQQRAADLLASIEASYSNWLGATAYLERVIGTPGTTQLTDVEVPVEASFLLGQRARMTAIARTVYLTSGAYAASRTRPLGTLAANMPAPATPMTGIGGEMQIATRGFAASAGVTPTGFPVMNLAAAATLHVPRNPWTLSFSRDSIRESQLAYAGLHDPGQPANVWGGVTANLGTVQYARGNALSGWYATASAGVVTGQHVRTNPEITGDAGAYRQVWARPTASLKLGVNIYGQHNVRNELFYTYGHGGYFSPEYFLLPAIPLTLTGNHGSRLQCEFAGNLGPQIIQEASAPYFPLDAHLQSFRGNPIYPAQSTLGLNYGVQGKTDYLFGEHWRFDAFVSADNADKYNRQVAGISLHYLFRGQHPAAHGSIGWFPSSGLRPYLIP